MSVSLIFLLTTWTDTQQAETVYIEAVNLTPQECASRMVAYDEAFPMWERGTPSCEIDQGLHAVSLSYQYEVKHNGEALTLLPCQYEDSTNCYWDADFRGNGQGSSFYDLDGVAYPVKRD